MKAEGQGVKAILDGKAAGYQALVEACATAQQAASLLLIEKLQEIAEIQAQAIQDLADREGGGVGRRRRT